VRGRKGEGERGCSSNSPFEGGRALKICPVGKFSEGASLQGQGDVVRKKQQKEKG